MSQWKETEIGLIPIEWEYVPFESVLLQPLRNGVYKSSEYHGRGTRVVNMGEIFAFDKLPSIEMSRIELSDDELEKSCVVEGDLLFARRSLVAEGAGKCTLVLSQEEPLTFESSIIRARPNFKKADSAYLLYLFSSPMGKYLLKTILRQVAVSGITGADLAKLNLPLPSLKEQKNVSHLLSCLDRKIENLRKQNETLEAIAQTLFKHWFVDFEFPNEDGKPYKSSGGAIELSELGEIPTGWSVGKVGDFCNVKHGYAFKGEFITAEETGQILLTPGNFRIGGGFNSSKYKYYSDDDYDNDYILEAGDLIITMTDLSKEGDTLGYPAFVPKPGNNIFLHNQRLGKVIDSQIDLFFLFFLLCRREYRSHILGTASGSTVRHTSPSRILECKFTVPNKKLLDHFSLVVSKLMSKTFANYEQIETLSKTRDVLLPKLISGQLRII